MSLSTHLTKQRDLLQTLIDQLDQERQLLGEGDVKPDSLNEITTNKQKTLAEIDTVDKQYRDLLQQQTTVNGALSDEQAAKQAGSLALWKQTRQLAEQAANANRLNGELLQVRMSGNQQMLNQLHALSGRDLYGPDGQASGGGSRISSEA